MENLMPCPSASQLKTHLEGLLDSPQQHTDFAAHLDACPSCQAKVETLLDTCEPAAHRRKLAAGTPLSTALDHQTLPKVPGYELLGRLGCGGMGVVYKARHLRLDRLVALKMIRNDRAADAESVKRFRREARSLLRLEHANVVRAVEAGEADGALFLAIEYIDGIDAAAYLRQRGPMAITAACEVVRQAALGLQYAHEQGIVHRDIKPSNLMLQRQEVGNDFPVVKILDLGLARRQAAEDDASSTLTGHGALIGTPDYMPPEQITDAKTAEAPADVYSLGCTLYHLLSGQAPFSGASLGLKFVLHQTQEPQPLVNLRREIPPGVVRIVQRMMAKDPQRRPSAAGVACELEALLRRGDLDSGRPLAALASEEDNILRVLRDYRPKPTRWPRLLVAAAVLVSAISVLCLVNRRDPPSIEVTKTGEQPTQGTSSILDRLRHEDLTAEQKVGWQTDGDKWPARHLVAVLGSTPARQWGDVNALAVSPDGKRIASSGWFTSVVSVWDAATLQRVAWVRTRGGVNGLSFLPDNETLLISTWDKSQSEVLSWRYTERLGPERIAGVLCDVFSPDGTRGLSRNPSGQTVLIDVRQGVVLWPKQQMGGEKIPTHLWVVPAFSPDGKQALVPGTQKGEVIRLDAITGTELATYSNIYPDWASLLAFLDSERILVGGQAGVHLVDLAIKDTPSKKIGDGRDLRDICVSNGRAVWVEYTSGLASVYDVASGRVVRQIRSNYNFNSCRLCGDRLVTGASTGHLQFWDLNSGKELFPRDYLHPYGFAVSPDGGQVAGAGDEGRLRLWDVVTGKPREVRAGEGRIRSVCYSSPGTLLCASHSREILQVDTTTGKVIGHIPFRGKAELRPQAMCRRSDGRVFVSARQVGQPDPREENVTLALEGTQEVVRFVGHTEQVIANALSADGNLLLTASWRSTLNEEYDVRLWDANTGKQLRGWKACDVSSVAFSRGTPPRWMALGVRNGISIYDLENARETPTWTKSVIAGDFKVAVTPDERILAIAKGNAAGYAGIWTRTGEKVVEAYWPGRIEAMVLAPDGRHFATANGDGTVYVVRLPGD